MGFRNQTELLNAAVDDLAFDQLLRADVLSLFDAMTSIQIMDPRMDMGMDIPAPHTRGKLDVPTIKDKHLCPKDVLSLIDELYAHEMSWLAGTPLPLSLFTCVYLHDASAIPNDLFKAYVIALLKSVSLMRTLIMAAGVYHEEDFLPETFGFNLYEETTDTQIAENLQKVDDDLLHQLKLLKELDAEDEQIQLIESLKSRIRHRKAIILWLSNTLKKKPPLMKKYLAQASVNLESVQRTLHWSHPMEDSFDFDYNRRLFQQAPPKPTNPPTKITGVCTLLTMLRQCNHISTMYAIIEATTSDSASIIQNCINRVGTMQPPPNLLTRSFAKHLLSSQDIFNPSALIRDLIRPPSFEAPASINETKVFDRWLELCSKTYQETLEINFKNPSRMKRKLAHLIIEWERCQAESEQLDMEIHRLCGIDVEEVVSSGLSQNEPYHLSCWVFERKLGAMITHLVLGFQLELYQNRELPYVFWHLHYFYDTLSHHLDRTNKISEQTAFMSSLVSKKEKKKTKMSTKVPERLAARVRARTLAFAKASLYKAYFEVALALWKHWDMKIEAEIYDDAVYFGRRFALFAQLGSPVPIRYDAELLKSGNVQPVDLLDGASKALMLVRRVMQQLSQSVVKPSNGFEVTNANIEAQEFSMVSRVVSTTTTSLEELNKGWPNWEKRGGPGTRFPCSFRLDIHPHLPSLHCS
ncbi:hypothetical protein SeMB42_g06062 [Synchytrium endobioticum]|uniref:Mak10 subunit, NatC N(Alpha)-terminal acetyltransferase n=1 Tax=Synchytrium endobioticum TaxID=286115 RepID=A0A507CMW1_9FUNG|nr:hypothetical protein SeMB42_g06062 [Synchytrium endobioticum]TPX41996.1 hypothetical protein SeLEV6574_g05818 [Synchytrium endobioticum]